MNALVTTNEQAYRASTDAAALCKAIVVATAQTIQGRRYVRVEGWQAIAVAHGCIASARDVEEVEGGVRAVGEIRRMSDGIVLSEAEGFVGKDEPTWYGGEAEVYDKAARKRVLKLLPKRPDYAIRAMAQTRAISRACRSAFAHVVVMMDAGLSTTPAEEVSYDVDTGEVVDITPPRELTEKERIAHEAISRLATVGACRTWWKEHYRAFDEKSERPGILERLKARVGAIEEAEARAAAESDFPGDRPLRSQADD